MSKNCLWDWPMTRPPEGPRSSLPDRSGSRLFNCLLWMMWFILLSPCFPLGVWNFGMCQREGPLWLIKTLAFPAHMSFPGGQGFEGVAVTCCWSDYACPTCLHWESALGSACLVSFWCRLSHAPVPLLMVLCILSLHKSWPWTGLRVESCESTQRNKNLVVVLVTPRHTLWLCFSSF